MDTSYRRDRRQFDNIDDYDAIMPEGDDFAENSARLDTVRRNVSEGLQKLNEQQRKVIVLKYFGQYRTDRGHSKSVKNIGIIAAKGKNGTLVRSGNTSVRA